MRNVIAILKPEPALHNNSNIIAFPDDNNNSASLEFKQKTENCGTKGVEILVLLKGLSTFWRTPEMPLINCEISLHLKWSTKYIIESGTANN